MALTVRFIGTKYLCGAGHIEFLPWAKEARSRINPSDLSWKQCKEAGCGRITAGIPYGLQSLNEVEK